MRVEVIMPQMGESIVEGTVVSWIKQVGDKVKRDEDIFTISTDKVDADIPSPAEGLLQEILVDVGATVEVGTVVAYIETDAQAVGASPGGSASAGGPRGVSASTATPPPSDSAPRASAPIAPDSSAADSRGERGSNGGELTSVDELRRQRSTPLVRRIAREHGIQDLSVVPGTGISGRVTKRDILDFVERAERIVVDEPEIDGVFERRRRGEPARDTETAPTLPAPRRAAPRSPEPTDAGPLDLTPPRVYVYPEDRVERMSRMRKSIAEHMVMSRRVAPHVQTVWECDFTRVARARAALKDRFRERGVKLTYTAFLVAAAARALRAHPLVNASVDGDTIVYRGSVNIGVAVALDDGLIVPVIRRADELSLVGLARAVNDMSARARDQQLKPEDVEGGTFTLTNPGVFGSLYGVPIINQPQVAILGVGAIAKRVVVAEDDSMRIAPMCVMCLSFDHRLIDGATADRFMQTYVGFLESYEVTEGVTV